MKNIHVLPTERPSRLSIVKNELVLFNTEGEGSMTQHIYITSDKEIKEGDWYYWIVTNMRIKAIRDNLGRLPKFGDGSRKIILTTDQDLIADGVQAISDEFLEWFVKNPSCEYVGIKSKKIWMDKNFNDISHWNRFKYEIIIPQEEVFEMYSHLYGKTVTMDDRFETKHIWSEALALKNKGRWVPQEEPKQEITGKEFYESADKVITIERQETIEEAAERLIINPTLEDKQVFKQGADWQAERMYSEEDFKLFARQYYREIKLDKSNLLWDDLADKCLEMFKKK